MGNTDPRLDDYVDSQQVQDKNTKQLRVGLMPTDGRDAYKRSSARSSRRSRAERTSYLVATGHLDLEETKELNEQNENPPNIKYQQSRKTSNNPTTTVHPNNFTTTDGFLNSATPSHFDFQESIFAQGKPKSNKSIRSSSRQQNNNRGKFQQTYTEVTLPMKTSPAFEYILKDNRRRNRRCCLWLLYSTLVTICIIVILFCCAHLVLRYQNF